MNTTENEINMLKTIEILLEGCKRSAGVVSLTSLKREGLEVPLEARLTCLQAVRSMTQLMLDNVDKAIEKLSASEDLPRE